MKILVINSGSSSVKSQLIDMDNESVLAKILVERIGIKGSIINYTRLNEKKIKIFEDVKDHEQAIKWILDILTDKEKGVIKTLEEITAVGHRVVHGGEKFTGSVLITSEVIKALYDHIELAPLHNPPNIKGIEAAMKFLDVVQVGVFDTAFHQTMPDYAYIYAIPYEYYTRDKIRRYGFHGTSHFYVSRRYAELVNKDIKDLNLITAHLGNGASITAIEGGKSVDTSMGFTPVEGLVMGTRCGDLDLGVLLYIMEKEKLSVEEANKLINKKSGLLGISGISSDDRDLEERYNTDKRAKLAKDVMSYRIKKYIGSYMAVLGRVDAIIFTGGIGENAHLVRRDALNGLESLGIKLDLQKNADTVRGKEGIISEEDSKIKIAVIPTNEELVIARDTKDIVSKILQKN